MRTRTWWPPFSAFREQRIFYGLKSVFRLFLRWPFSLWLLLTLFRQFIIRVSSNIIAIVFAGFWLPYRKTIPSRFDELMPS